MYLFKYLLVSNTSVCTNVEQHSFAFGGDIMLAQNESSLRPKSDEHNLGVAIKLHHRPFENAKVLHLTNKQSHTHSQDITCALALRNTIAVIHPSTITRIASAKTDDLWLSRLIAFFDAKDYDIVGYEMPRVITELNLHVTNIALQYTCLAKEEFDDDVTLRCVIYSKQLKHNDTCRLCLDSAHVSSRIVASFSQLKLHCMFEDARLYLAKYRSPIAHKRKSLTPQKPHRSVTFEQQTLVGHGAEMQTLEQINDAKFVCALKMGLFDLEVGMDGWMCKC